MRRKRRNHSPGFKAKVAPWRQSERTKQLLNSPGSMTRASQPDRRVEETVVGGRRNGLPRRPG